MLLCTRQQAVYRYVCVVTNYQCILTTRKIRSRTDSDSRDARTAPRIFKATPDTVILCHPDAFHRLRLIHLGYSNHVLHLPVSWRPTHHDGILCPTLHEKIGMARRNLMHYLLHSSTVLHCCRYLELRSMAEHTETYTTRYSWTIYYSSLKNAIWPGRDYQSKTPFAIPLFNGAMAVRYPNSGRLLSVCHAT